MNVCTHRIQAESMRYAKLLACSSIGFLCSLVSFAQEKPAKKVLFGTGVTTAEIAGFRGYSSSSFNSAGTPNFGRNELDAKLAVYNNPTHRQWLYDSLNKQTGAVSAFLVTKDGERIDITPKVDSILRLRKQRKDAMTH